MWLCVPKQKRTSLPSCICAPYKRPLYVPPHTCMYGGLLVAVVACSYIRIWAGLALNGTSNSGFLTVWLSRGTNYTTTGTKCASMIGIIGGTDAIVTCPEANGTNYVTIERYDALTADRLVIHELQVFSASESKLRCIGIGIAAKLPRCSCSLCCLRRDAVSPCGLPGCLMHLSVDARAVAISSVVCMHQACASFHCPCSLPHQHHRGSSRW